MNQSPTVNDLIDHASVSQKEGTQRAFGGEYVEMLEERCAWREHGTSIPLFPNIGYASFHLAAPELYLFIINH